jgi:hypothetical protein
MHNVLPNIPNLIIMMLTGHARRFPAKIKSEGLNAYKDIFMLGQVSFVRIFHAYVCIYAYMYARICDVFMREVYMHTYMPTRTFPYVLK